MKTTRTAYQEPSSSVTFSEDPFYTENDFRSSEHQRRRRSGDGRRCIAGWGSIRREREWKRRGSGPPMKLEGKTYDEIKAQCLLQDCLFEDPDFPADDSKIFPSRGSSHYEWKRPGELISEPRLFVDGASRLDVRQGELGDCWLLAAISCLSQYPGLMKQVVPEDQGFTSAEDYCGIFRFNFWVFGKWMEVFVDDRLPTKNGRLAFMHSQNKNEFWTALLEKAYAKWVWIIMVLKQYTHRLEYGLATHAIDAATHAGFSRVEYSSCAVAVTRQSNFSREHTRVSGIALATNTSALVPVTTNASCVVPCWLFGLVAVYVTPVFAVSSITRYSGAPLDGQIDK